MLFEKLKSEDDLESLLTDMKIEADQRANEWMNEWYRETAQTPGITRREGEKTGAVVSSELCTKIVLQI